MLPPPNVNLAFLKNLLQECEVARKEAAIWRRRQSGLDISAEDEAFFAELRLASIATGKKNVVDDDDDNDNESKGIMVGVNVPQEGEPVTEITAKLDGQGEKNDVADCKGGSVNSVSSVTAKREADSQKGGPPAQTTTPTTEKSTSEKSESADFSPKVTTNLPEKSSTKTSDHPQEPEGTKHRLADEPEKENQTVELPEDYKAEESPIDIEELIRQNPELTLKEIVFSVIAQVAEREGVEGTKNFLRTLPPAVLDLFEGVDPLPGSFGQRSQSDLATPVASKEASKADDGTSDPAQSSSISGSAMASSSTLASKPLLPEYGPPVTVEGGRIICKAHSKGICRACGIDYTDVSLLDQSIRGLSLGEIEHTLNYRDKTGGFVPVFVRGGGQFAAKDAVERETEHPSVEEPDRQLGVVFDLANLKRVQVVFGPVSRFVPQWDDEVMGRAMPPSLDYRKPPVEDVPIDQLQLVDCKECQLTWHGGHRNLVEMAGSHPSHHCRYLPIAGPSRSVLVHVDGAFTPACAGTVAGAHGQGEGSEGSAGPSASTAAREARAGMGVYFAEGSKYNLSEAFDRSVFKFADPRNGNHPAVVLNQVTPQLAAVVRALATVRERVVPERAEEVRAASACNSQHAARGAERFRVVVCTDSLDVVDAMCYRLYNDWWPRGLNEGVVASARKAEKAKNKGKKAKKAKEGKTPVPVPRGHVSWDDFVVKENNGKLVLVSKSTGCLVPNSDGILKIAREVALLGAEGVTVCYYLISAKENIAADRLARAGMNL